MQVTSRRPAETTSQNNFSGEGKPIELAKPSNPDGGLELRLLLRPLVKWWWLLIIVPILCGGVAYYTIQRGTTYYQARTLLNIGPSLKQIEDQAPPLVTLRLGAIYSQLLVHENFLKMVAQQSEAHLTEEQIRQSVVVYFRSGTPYFEVQIVDSNASRCLLTLKTIAKLLTEESPQLQELSKALQQKFLVERQLELENLIDYRKYELTELNQQLGVDGETSGKNILITNNTNILKSEVENYSQELKEIEQFTSNTEPNQLQIVEEPHLIPLVLGPQPKNAALALAVISLTLLIILIYLIEKLDNRVLNKQQVAQLLGRPILLLKHRRRNQYLHQLELLAADLLASYSANRNCDRLRVLVVYEQYTRDVVQLVQGLAKALAELGVSVNVVIARDSTSGRKSRQTSSKDTMDTIETMTTQLPLEDGEFQNTAVQWEFMVQSWPTSLKYLSVISTDCDSALVLCSLKRSKKKALSGLAGFFQVSRLEVGGVILW